MGQNKTADFSFLFFFFFFLFYFHKPKCLRPSNRYMLMVHKDNREERIRIKLQTIYTNFTCHLAAHNLQSQIWSHCLYVLACTVSRLEMLVCRILFTISLRQRPTVSGKVRPVNFVSSLSVWGHGRNERRTVELPSHNVAKRATLCTS